MENHSPKLYDAYKETALKLLSSIEDSDEKPALQGKTFGMISASSPEGKTVNAINLSFILGRLQKKVLLIDGNLSNPLLTGTLESGDLPGLTEAADNKMPCPQAILHNSAHGFDFLPSGKAPLDSTAVFHSAAWQSLFLDLRKEYQYIIIDFPPLETSQDALAVAGQIDGYLLTVRDKKTRTEQITGIEKHIMNAKGKLAGIIYNMNY